MLQITAIAIPHKAVIPIPTDDTWDIYLNRQLVASGYPSERAAQLELDVIAFSAMFGTLHLDPRGAVADQAVDLAMQLMWQLFQADAVRLRIERARREIIQTTSVMPVYAIQPDGSLHVRASHPRSGQPYAYHVATTILPHSPDNHLLPERYRIREACDCPDFAQRMQQHAGICKHVAAKLILFLAQQGIDALRHLSERLAAMSSRAAIDSIADDAVLLAYPLPWEALVETSCTRIVAANEATVLACSTEETALACWIVCTANATLAAQALANNA
jgi:hypothetical protein